jgi:hypothetical protein
VDADAIEVTLDNRSRNARRMRRNGLQACGLEPVIGIEPMACRLQGAHEPSPAVARRRLMRL